MDGRGGHGLLYSRREKVIEKEVTRVNFVSGHGTGLTRDFSENIKELREQCWPLLKSYTLSTQN